MFKTDIWRFDGNQTDQRSDQLAVEEPLEIRLSFVEGDQRQIRTLAITMRTPGHDFDLVRGFLFTEGIISGPQDVLKIRHLSTSEAPSGDNVVLVDLSPEVQLDWKNLSRHFYTSSSCGVCGKGSIEMVRMHTCYFPIRRRPLFAAQTILGLPDAMREAQTVFSATGGIHASALFSASGELLALREDVGRHNALDKLIGEVLERDWVPLRDHLLLVSGRVSFELVQKALMAGVPVLVAVGAPSSLAVELAEENGMTLIGFLRGNRFNVYSGTERLHYNEKMNHKTQRI